MAFKFPSIVAKDCDRRQSGARFQVGPHPCTGDGRRAHGIVDMVTEMVGSALITIEQDVASVAAFVVLSIEEVKYVELDCVRLCCIFKLEK